MNFMSGCNYWASNAGTEMWRRFDENAIRKDMEILSAHGIEYLRVFPNWRDFQPVHVLYGQGNKRKEFVDNNENTFKNPYFVDMEMIDKFNTFCKITSQYNMKLIVGIVTGWMSGRTFVPPVLEGVNLYTDATALMLEQKYVKAIVDFTGDNSNIYAWDLGNECNCMSCAPDRETAAAWTAMISNAIRANDKLKRPVISGMHGLCLNSSSNNSWTIKDQGENTDILTTHPYPYFVEYCNKDELNSYRTLLHATCEGVYYSDISKKPCLTEEIGTLGPCNCDEDTASEFLKVNLYSNWAHGSLGVLWWCAFDQIKLNTAPYRWQMIERELGLITADSKPKKMLLEYKNFRTWLDNFGKELPLPGYDAVCVLNKSMWKSWGTVYMTYLLCKQSHINIKFVASDDDLPDCKTYILPSLDACEFSKEMFDKIVARVNCGATLYISNDTGFIADFEAVTGVHIKNSKMADESLTMLLDSEKINFRRKKRFIIETSSAEAIACDSLDIPVLTKNKLGKGTVFYLNFPLETMLLDENNAFDTNRHKIYDHIFSYINDSHPIKINNPFVGITFHYEKDICYAVMINYSDKEQPVDMLLQNGYKIAGFYGKNKDIIPPFEALVITLEK